MNVSPSPMKPPPRTAAAHAARERERMKRWRSMSAPNLLALKARLEARDMPVPVMLFERLRIEIKAMKKDSHYRAAILRDADPLGRPAPRAKHFNNPRSVGR